MKKRRSLQERLDDQRALVGFLQSHPNLAITEMAGISGYDFLILDGEHGLFTETDYLQTLQVLESTDVAAFVRLAGHNTQAIGRYLDMGADGIIVPNVSTADQATALARAMTYPPIGTRGFGASLQRTTRYGLDVTAHLKCPRGNACLLLMIESRTGVDDIEKLLAVDGIDGVFIGPFDLTADLGSAGDFSLPSYSQALTRIERAASDCGKVMGTAPHPGHPLEALFSRGHRLLLIGADTPLIREAMTSQVAAAKSCFQPTDV